MKQSIAYLTVQTGFAEIMSAQHAALIAQADVL
jgi:hypothetical protein